VGVSKCEGVVCRADVDCRVSECSSRTGRCELRDEDDNAKCDDLDPTTTNDRCLGGKCLGQRSCDNIVCPPRGGCFTEGICRLGDCEYSEIADGGPCDDGKDDTYSDTCRGGVCVGIVSLCAAVNCSTPPAGSCYETGTCDPKTGLCDHPLLPEGSTCNEAGVAGVCAQGLCLEPVDSCFDASCPPPANPCLFATCSEGTCKNFHKAGTATCPDVDNDPTTRDYCLNGTCVSVDRCQNIQCGTSAGACMQNPSCNRLTGICEPHNQPEGTPCYDLPEGMIDGLCAAGVCIGRRDPCYQVECAVETSCVASVTCIAGECVPTWVEDGTACDDGSSVTSGDKCADGQCLGMDACADVGCQPSPCRVSVLCVFGQCYDSKEVLPDGSACEDGNQETSGDVCRGGICQGIVNTTSTTTTTISITTTTATSTTTATTTATNTTAATTATTPTSYTCTTDKYCWTKKCDAERHICTGCKVGYFLTRSGQCVAACPEGDIANGMGQNDRRCLEGPISICDTASEACVCPDDLGKCNMCRLSLLQNATCTACNPTKYAVMGSDNITRCQTEIVCKGSSFEEMPSRSCHCKTDVIRTNDCFRCRFSGGQYDKTATKTCVRCRNSKYLSGDQCIDGTECANGEIPTLPGAYGRKCQVPFECRGSRILDGPNRGKSCKCEPGCQHCAWTEAGTICFKCRNKQFLDLFGNCVPSCPSDQAGIGVSAYGRFCSDAPVVCRNKKTMDLVSRRCTCPKGCIHCDFALGGTAPEDALCSKCASGRVLTAGKCLK